MFRRPNGWLQDIGQGHTPMPLQEIAPTGDRAGDAGRVTGVSRHLAIAGLLQFGNGGGPCRPT